MRSLLSAVLGYLVIGATLTLAKSQPAPSLTQVCSKGSCKNFLIASCSFGCNGQVVFREPQYQDGNRLVQTKSEGHDHDDHDDHHHEDDEEDVDENIYRSSDVYDEEDERRRKGVDADPRLTGDFDFKNLEKNTKYRLSVHEYNDLGKKCRYIGEFYNPRDLKFAPGVKTFKTDCDGKFTKRFKKLSLSISTENSIINRSCFLEKIPDREKECKPCQK